MKLTARQVETAKPKDKPYKLADGGGLTRLAGDPSKGSDFQHLHYIPKINLAETHHRKKCPTNPRLPYVV